MLRTYILEYHTFVRMALLLNCSILICYVNAISTHYHLIMELVINLVHLQLLSYSVTKYTTC